MKNIFSIDGKIGNESLFNALRIIGRYFTLAIFGLLCLSATNAQTQHDLRVVRISLVGNTLTIALRLNTNASVGDVNSYDADINFDNSVLSNPRNVRPGPGDAGMGGTGTRGTPALISWHLNTPTRFRVVAQLNPDPPETFGYGLQDTVLLDFTVIPNPPTSTSIILTRVSATEYPPNSLKITTPADNIISLVGPTAATGLITSGRVTNATGRGLPDARIFAIDQSGLRKMALTNSLGYYRFDDLSAGETYVFSVMRKGYVFSNAAQLVNLTEDRSDLNFVADNKVVVRKIF
jgi:hypothetical protein